MSETKAYYRNFLTMLSGNTLSQLIPFLMAPVLTRIFLPEEFAIYANFLAISSMIGVVAAGRLELAIPITKEKKGAQEIAFTGLVITVVLALLSFVFPLFSDFFAGMFKSPVLANFLIAVPIAVLSYGMLGVANNWVLRHKKYSVLSIGKVSQSFINSGLAALLGYLGWGTTGLVVGWLVSQFVSILVLVLSMNFNINWRDYNITTIKTTVREHKDFPLINSLHAFTDIFATQFVLFWIISSEFGLVELGLFSMMHRYVRQPVVLITSSVSQIFYAEASSAINAGKSAVPILRKTVLTSMAFSFPFVAIIFFFAPQLFGWYFGPKWTVAGEYARYIIPILFLMFIVSPISGIPILLNKQRTAYMISSIGYAFTLGSFFVATYLKWSFADALILYGIAYATLQCVYLYWMYTLIKRQHAGTR